MNQALYLLIIRKAVFIFGFLLSITFQQAKAQSPGEIWGMTGAGGTFGVGTIFKTAPDGSNFSIQHSFSTPTPGLAYNCSLTLAPDGKFYGFTRSGGIHASGVIFEYGPATNSYTVDYHLNTGKPGTTSAPGPRLVLASSGKLYGFTINGGSNNFGVIFEFDPVAKSYSKIYDLNSTLQGLTPASDGKLYGLTSDGGSSGNGTLFSLDPVSTTFAIEYNFDLTNGGSPTGNVLQASDGKLYGVTLNGGTGSKGVLFQFDPISKTYAKTHDFTSTSSTTRPIAPLIESATGILNGVTSEAIYDYVISTATYTKRLTFGSSTGTFPQSGIMKASNGLLYGVTTGAGANGGGTLYEYNPTTFACTKKFDFPDAGSNTQTVLVEGTSNKLYGIQNLGPASSGLIFEYDFSGSTYTKKIDFQSCPDGCIPKGALLQSASGKVYGTTGNGGSNNAGTLFELDLATGTPNTLVNFTSTLGRVPDGGVVELNGLLYGVTQFGGLNDAGTLYSYDPASAITKLVDFSTYNISSPNRSLVVANGKLYGTTRFGGGGAIGALFEYDPVSNTLTNKYNFTGSDGFGSRGLMILASNGKLYGTTGGGGTNGQGVLFEYDLTSNTYTKKIDLSTTNGYSNFGPLIEGPGGKLYFSTQLGGANGGGTISEYDINTSSLVTKYNFDSSSGVGSTGGLVFAFNGKLYATTFSGGNNGIGTFFEFDLSSNSFSKKHDFSGLDGATPDLLVPMQIGKSQSITFSGIPAKTYGDPTFQISATSSSSLPITFTSSDQTIATVSGNAVTIQTAGTVKITATQAGDSKYYQASVQQTLTINKATQSIEFPSIPEKKVGDQPFDLPLSASSGLPISYQSSNQAVATVTGNKVTILSNGTTNISASQSGNINYLAAQVVQQPLLVTVVTGVEKLLPSIVAYPNPTKDEFIVQLPETEKENHLSLFSYEGRVVEERSSIMKEEYFSLKEQANGLYFLKIQMEKEIKYLKIIKQ